MADIEKLRRIVDIRDRLQAGARLTVERMMDDYGVNRRTVTRDVETLADALDMDLVEEKTGDGRKVWSAAPRSRKVEVQYTILEVMALFLGKRLFDFLEGTTLEERFAGVYSRIESQVRLCDPGQRRILSGDGLAGGRGSGVGLLLSRAPKINSREACSFVVEWILCQVPKRKTRLSGLCAYCLSTLRAHATYALDRARSTPPLTFRYTPPTTNGEEIMKAVLIALLCSVFVFACQSESTEAPKEPDEPKKTEAPTMPDEPEGLVKPEKSDGEASEGPEIVKAFAAGLTINPNKYISLRAATGKCMHKEGPNIDNGNPIHLWDCMNNDNANWIYEEKTGYIRLASNPAKCMHKKWRSDNNGSPIHLWDCMNNNNAKWTYEASTGYIRLRSNTAKCMHITHPNTDNGNPIHLWDCKNIANAKWRISSITPRLEPAPECVPTARTGVIDVNNNTSFGCSDTDAGNHPLRGGRLFDKWRNLGSSILGRDQSSSYGDKDEVCEYFCDGDKIKRQYWLCPCGNVSKKYGDFCKSHPPGIQTEEVCTWKLESSASYSYTPNTTAAECEEIAKESGYIFSQKTPEGLTECECGTESKLVWFSGSNCMKYPLWCTIVVGERATAEAPE